MKPQRVFLISKQFWPVSGETSLLASAFANRLGDLMEHVDVVTWRLIRQWPDRFQYGPCCVIRLPQSQRPNWSPGTLGYYGRNRWHRSLQRWIITQGDRYDAGFIFEFEGDLLAPTIIVAKTGIPVISRIEQKHLAGMTRNLSRDIRAIKSNPVGLVTPDQRLLMDPLSFANGPLSGLSYIADGYETPQESLRSKSEAREVLAGVHPIFKLEKAALLAVCGSDLTFESGVFSLVRAWRRVLADQPDARLWLIGTGKNSPELFQRICDLDLQHSVLLTGNFDEIDDVLSAADAYIIPGSQPAGWYSSAAGQVGLTIIHHRDSPAMEAISNSVNRIPFDDDSRPIDFVLSRWASSRWQAEENSGLTLVQRQAAQGLVAEMVDQYLARLEQQVIRQT